MQCSRDILILYDAHACYTSTVWEYLDSFRRFSRNRIFFAHATHLSECDYTLDAFDAVILHYSIALREPGHLRPSFCEALRRYDGPKWFIVQDEYIRTDRTRECIAELGIDTVFTCVPPEHVREVYYGEQLAHLRFEHVLTGYVPYRFDRPQPLPSRPLEERSIVMGYRGRRLGFWLGRFAQEKYLIGDRMKQECQERGVACDIAMEESDRIYGEAWFDFIGNCRSMLGTESGANLFDFDGTLEKQISEYVRRHPNATFDDVESKFIGKREGKITMNQISPRIFEMIGMQTPMVLMEGRYSDVLIPDRHYIPIRKDYSNLGEVFERLQDLPALKVMTNRAYEDVISSGKYSYRVLIERIDKLLTERILHPKGTRFFFMIGGFENEITPESALLYPKCMNQLPTTIPLGPSNASAAAVPDKLNRVFVDAGDWVLCKRLVLRLSRLIVPATLRPALMGLYSRMKRVFSHSSIPVVSTQTAIEEK